MLSLQNHATTLRSRHSQNSSHQNNVTNAVFIFLQGQGMLNYLNILKKLLFPRTKKLKQ